MHRNTSPGPKFYAVVIVTSLLAAILFVASSQSPSIAAPQATSSKAWTSASDLQAKIDELAADGGTLTLPVGEFEIVTPLVIGADNVRIIGQGPATHLLNRCPDHQPAIIVRNVKYPESRRARVLRASLEDFRISGTQESGDGILAEGADEFHLTGLTIDHHGGNGMHLHDCYENPRITDNMITYNGAAGILLERCHDIVVNANHLEENKDALRCLDGFNLCMNGNNIDDHLRHGVVIENTYGSVLSGNMIEECSGTAIILDRNCYGITISANVIAHHLGGGVHLLDAWGCAVSGNTFTLVYNDSIRVGPASGRLTLSANNFSNSWIGGRAKRPRGGNEPMLGDAGTGVTLDGTSDINLTGNSFSGLTTPAITAKNGCQRILIADNVITDVNRLNSSAGVKSIDIGDATDCIIEDNLGADHSSP